MVWTPAGNYKASADQKHFIRHLAQVETLLTKAGMSVLILRTGQPFHLVATSDAELRLIQVICGCGRLIEGKLWDPHDTPAPDRRYPVFREIWTVKATPSGSTIVRTVRI